MSDTPPTEDAADDVASMYRKSSAQYSAGPSARTRQLILEHATRLATDRAHITATERGLQPESMPGFERPANLTKSSRPRWRRPLLVGSLAAAALAGLLVGPQYLRPVHPLIDIPATRTAVPAQPKFAISTDASESRAAPATGASQEVMNSPVPESASATPVLAERAAPPAAAANPDRKTSGSSAREATSGAVADSAQPSNEAVIITGARRQGAAESARRDASQANRVASEARVATAGAPTDAARTIDGRDSEGRTALMRAVLSGQLTEINDLLRRGADPGVPDNMGVTPLQAARAKNEPEIADALVRAGAQ